MPNRAPHPTYYLLNDPAGARNIAYRRAAGRDCRVGRDANCHSTPDAYEWSPSNGSGRPPSSLTTAGRFTLATMCAALAGRGIGKIAILGDSVAWSQFQSMWLLLGALEHGGPPPFRPSSVQLSVRCKAQRSATSYTATSNSNSIIELLYVRADSLNASITARTVSEADLTVLSAGAWYSPRHVRGVHGAASAAVGSAGGGASLGGAGHDGIAWLLFARHLLAVRDALTEAGLPNAAHRLVWRTSGVAHYACDTHLKPHGDLSEALAHQLSGLLTCGTRCMELGWHLHAAYDRTALDVLKPLGVLPLDVRPMSVLRPDAHSQRRFAERPREPDCLHLALPGVVDWWNALLVAAVQTCGFNDPGRPRLRLQGSQGSTRKSAGAAAQHQQRR